MWSVFFVLLSYLDRDVVRGNLLSHAVDAEKNKEMFSSINGTVCAQTSSVGESYLHQVSDGAEVVRTVVGPAGRRVNCSVVVNQMEVKSFMHECRLGLKERGAARQLDAPFTHMDEAKTMCRELKERSERSVRRHEGGDRSPQEDEVLKRSKRGFTYPGTLWCGAGNMADDYNQLGEFAETDNCCRVHDHCPHVIHAFSSKYGRTNFKWHSISHCDCDNDLKACLRTVNDTSSRVVGQAFFNVIGVPCFEFTYEEQCAERHWYGLCKRYEKLPVAVLREAVPYDYGGIDVIDELTVAPPKRKDPKKFNEAEQPDSATQGAMPSPEDASLRNVVTAAEDFIKVLATVSTSQSSTADSDKDATQSSEKKKKKKNTGKKKKPNRKQKGKGKGRKRKPKAEAGVKTVEGAAVPPPARAEEAPPLSNFIRESNKLGRSNTNGVDKSELELRRKDEPSNEVMKDEPAVDKEPVSITSPPMVQKEPAESHAETMSEENPVSSSTANVTSHNGKHRRESIKTKKKSRKMLRSSDELVSNTDDLNAVPHLATTARPGRHVAEQQLAISTASVPMSIPKDQRNRSKERADKGRRKNRKKVSTDAPIVLAEQPTSSADSLKGIPHTGAPTVPPVLTSDQQSFHGPHVDRQHGEDTARTLSDLRKQRSKEKVLRRSRRRKTAVSPLSEHQLFSHGGSESSVPATPYPRVALVHPASAAATQETETVGSGLHWAPKRRRGNPSLKQTKPAATSAPSVGSVNEPTSVSSAPSMSPLQLSVERAEAQFNKKKRRKVSRSTRQQ